MKRLLVTLILAGAVTFGGATETQAQESTFTFGPGVAFHDDFDLGIGVWAAVPMPSIHEQVGLWGSFLYFFPDGGVDIPGAGSVDVSYWELNGGLSYSFPVEGSVTPYVLGGLVVARASVDYSGPFDDIIDAGYGDTEIGLNLGGGIRAMLGESIVGVAGARLELRDGGGFVIEAGIGFPMGG